MGGWGGIWLYAFNICVEFYFFFPFFSFKWVFYVETVIQNHKSWAKRNLQRPKTIFKF